MIKNILLLKGLTSSELFTFAGNGLIKGKINELGKMIPARVRLFEKTTGRLVADITTNQNGEYVFNNLAKTKFFIISHHPNTQFNAVIQDNVVPK